jgi:hypothetical protein
MRARLSAGRLRAFDAVGISDGRGRDDGRGDQSQAANSAATRIDVSQ